MKPLIESDYPPTPTSRNGNGLGFLREPFRTLRNTAPFHLRPGMRFEREAAKALIAAMREAADTICRVPAHFITYPGRGNQVFGAKRMNVRVRDEVVSIDEPFLRSFGEFTVPTHVWRTLARLNVWIEPVLLGERIALMQQYGRRQGRHLQYDALNPALAWLDPVRDAQLARQRATELIAAGEALHCVWSSQAPSLRSLDIDHCFPFSVWPCSDLWILLPSSRAVNQREKKDKLVSAACLANARDSMLDW